MLQEAIHASLKPEEDGLSPTKTPHDGRPGIALVYNPILNSKGHDSLTPIDVDKLPASVHSDGYSVLGPEELSAIKSTLDAHLRFMRSKAQAPIIAHLLGRDNLMLIDSLVTRRNIRECEINQNFRLYDLLTMLSYRFTTDAVLTCYMHYLSSVYPNVHFMNPVRPFCKEKTDKPINLHNLEKRAHAQVKSWKPIKK